MPQSKPYILGHRGSMATHQENSIAAFQEAYDAGADGVEIDLQMTKDGQLVIFHDFEKDGKLINQCKADELGALLFSEFCEKMQEWKMRVNLEIKWREEYERSLVPTKLVEMVHHYGLKDVYYSSFDLETLEIVRSLDPQAKLGLAIKDEIPKSANVQIISADYKLLNEGVVKRLHDAGYFVTTWPVNEEADWQKMIECGVDEIMTDRPRDLVDFKKSLTP